MRAFYKSVRSKPLGKTVWARGALDRHAAFFWAQD